MLVEVAKVTKTKNGNFMTKVFSEREELVLGTTMKERTTYYMFLSAQLNVGFRGDIDISKFDAVTKEHKFPDENGKEITRKLTTLFLKRG